ncbi:MAG: amidohydrolase family protein [Vicinamibacterales bacterium]
MRIIATEEACAFPDQVAAIRTLAAHPGDDADLAMWNWVFSPGNGTLLRRLLDLDTERIALMDESGVDVHVLSLTAPGVQMFDADTATNIASDTNDGLAEAIRRHPTRFAALGSFAPQDPKRAAKEIDRAITKLKLNGLIVNSHTNGEYLDDRKFWPIFEAAVAVKAPLYIHPRNPPLPASLILKGSYNLYSAIWGFHVETGIHAMRLIVNGVFDAFPELTIVLGHMGEGLPFWLYRIDRRWRGTLKRGRPSDYVRHNFVMTTSGVNSHETLKYCHSVLGADRLMFAIDYPYEDTPESVQFVRTAPLANVDLEKIAHRNAERVFGIAPSLV